MGFLDKLFTGPKAYVERGVCLTQELVHVLHLDGWATASPVVPIYSPAEIEAISKKLTDFWKTAKPCPGDGLGVEIPVFFPPEFVPDVQRRLAAEALLQVANREWHYGLNEALTQDWKERVSTYLKAWACNSDPTTLLHAAELMAKAGHDEEARKTLQVVLLFKSYALAINYYGERSKATDRLIDSIIEEAKTKLQRLDA